MQGLLGDDARLAKKPQLDVTRRAFQPKKYIRNALKSISHGTFENELVDDVGAAEQTTAEALKQLIRDNLGVFIESKDAMEAVFKTDHELFTGEALASIVAAFETAQAGCEGLVKPIMESYLDVQDSRQSHSTLERLHSVLSVPGAVYRYCGVRVVPSKSAMQLVRSSRRRAATVSAAHGRERKTSPSGEAGSDMDSEEREEREDSALLDGGDNDEEAEETEDSGDDRKREDSDGNSSVTAAAAATAAAARAYAVRGALEDLPDGSAGGAGGFSDYLLEPGEELFLWYGTPLARRKDEDAQRLLEESESDYEAAVLCLRRAMLYMEENYDLEDGSLLAAEDVDEPSEGSGVLAGGANAPAGRRRVSAVHRSPFTFRFSLALLRAALYLEEQLSKDLVRANAADTVLIEDTLSMMMDVSIVTVKMWKLCTVLQADLRRRSSERALKGLRDQLAEEVETAAAAQSPRLSFAFPESANSSVANTSFAKERVDTQRVQGGSRRRPRRLYHPAQYFISSTQRMHTRLTRASAAALLWEASEWRKKASLPSHAEAERRQARRRAEHEEAGVTESVSGGGGSFDASLQLTGGVLGNTADSFAATSAFLPAGGSREEGRKGGGAGTTQPGYDDELSSMSFTVSALKVGGFSDSLGVSALPPQGEAEMESYASSILAAFCTPEERFDTYTTFSVGSLNMSDILEGSCIQVLMHSKAMLQQLSDRSDTEAAIMAEGALLHTFALRLSEACMANLEHVIESYWGGIATTIHGGAFDFTPDASTPLGRVLAELLGEGGGPTASSAASRGQDPPRQANEAAGSEGSGGGEVGAALAEAAAADVVPEVRFVPALPQSIRPGDDDDDDEAAAAGPLSQPLTPRANGHGNAATTTLRDLSVRAVRRMTRSASNVLQSLFLAFVNRVVLNGFVRPMSRYTRGDLLLHSADERVELHAAILVEVIVGQWERIMARVSEAVLRIKVVIGESCSTTTMTVNEQVEEARELLGELEQLRTSCFRCYTHGIGTLSKAYITLLPMLQCSEDSASLEHRVRARLSRNSVSSSLPSKLLNLLTVVLDRTVPFLRRFAEVYDSADLFAAKAEDFGPERTAAGNAPSIRGQRRTLRRRRQGSSDSVRVAVDPVTQFVASAHAKVVLEHLEEHEELLQALASNLLQTFVDMLHSKAQRVSSGASGGLTFGDPEEQERGIMESMADAICLPTAVAPMLVDQLLVPCVFELVACQHSTVPTEIASIVRERKAAFEQMYMFRVGEHCQLAVDAMVRMYLAIPQQHITREVRENGFAAPLFDWQRLSGPTAAGVRPYLSNCIVHIAKAHETLNWMHQPAIGAAVTQRLVAHLAVAFATAVTTDINAFEMSLECSRDFHLHGLLLVEAEALTVLSVVRAVMESVNKNPRAGEVLRELLLAKEVLSSVTQAIVQRDNKICDGVGRGELLPSTAGDAASATQRERAGVRERMVAAAVANLRYMVSAICTHLEDTALMPASTLPFQQQISSRVTESIAERLARRKEGYEVHHATKPRRGAPSTQRRQKKGSEAADGADGAPQKAKRLSRHRAASSVEVDDHPLPRTPSVSPPPHDAEEVAVPSIVTDGIAAALHQSTDNQKHQGGGAPAPHRRTLRRSRAQGLAPEGEEASAASPTPIMKSVPPAAAAAAAAATPAQQQLSPEELAVPRRARRRVVGTAALPVGGAPEGESGARRGRRPNRFKRSGAV